MKNLKFEYEEETRTITMFIDNNKAGFITVSEDKIEYVEINKEYRGKGLYVQLLISALNMTGFDSLRSCNRNENSNPCWEDWTSKDLDFEDNCYVCLDDNEKGLWFTKED